jgi:hypothetical protein
MATNSTRKAARCGALSILKWAVAVWTMTGVSVPRAAAQDWGDPAASARIKTGPVAITPTFSIVNLGIDSNIFNDVADPKSDGTATIEPAINSWIRLGRGWFGASNRLDYVHYNTYQSQGGVSSFNNFQMDVPFNRVRLHGAVTLDNAYDRPALDIDTRVRHRTYGQTGGFDLRLGSTTLGVAADRATISFDRGAFALGHELAAELNRETDSVNVALQKPLTPLTTFVVRTSTQRTRFGETSERDNTITLLAAGMSFKPLALLTGRIEVGTLRVKADQREPFQGLATNVDLGYTLRSATHLSVGLARSVNYSPDPSAPYYLLNTQTLAFDHRFSPRWDALGSVTRSSSSYDSNVGLANQVYVYTSGFGCRLGDRGRFSLNVSSTRRIVPPDSRMGSYRALRVFSSFTYGI